MYRCEAASVEGFIQQLAVCYIARGYFFYRAGSIPEGKDALSIDAKLIEKYEINVSKWTRLRRKRLGLGNVQYIRFGRFFVIVATHGEHRFFTEEAEIRDIRRHPVRFAGYSVSYRKGKDGKWHPSVRIDSLEFRLLKQDLLLGALTPRTEILCSRIKTLGFAPYAPIRNQYFELLRAINRRRRTAGLEEVPSWVVPTRRTPVPAFETPQSCKLAPQPFELHREEDFALMSHGSPESCSRAVIAK